MLKTIFFQGIYTRAVYVRATAGHFMKTYGNYTIVLGLNGT
jgi:hypothetical protein